MFKTLLLISITLCTSVHAKLPLYQFGLAVGGGYLSDYPASDQGRARSIIVPTAIYRGEVFKSDDRGTRAHFYQSKYTNIDLSFSASFPANSKDNRARSEMKDLDWLGELGPRFNTIIYKGHKTQIEIEIPLRFVFSTDFEFTKNRGYRLQPQLDLRHRLGRYLELSMSYRHNWVTEPLADYFYEVTRSDANETREAYNAKPGFIGRSLSSFLVYEFKDMLSVVGVRYSNYSGSANENSPLYRVNNDTAVFFGINYFFYKSTTKKR